MTQTGLYDPRHEHDACGIGFVADAAGTPSRGIVEAALEGLCRVKHRGAVAADSKSGDGAGLLLPLPAAFFAAAAALLAVLAGPHHPTGVAPGVRAGGVDLGLAYSQFRAEAGELAGELPDDFYVFRHIADGAPSRGAFRAAVMECVRAAYDRATELGNT